MLIQRVEIMESILLNNLLRVTRNKNIATIYLDEYFVFPTHAQFRATYQGLLDSPDIDTLQIDFASVRHLDSFALGMLLILRDRTNRGGKSICLVKPSALVADAFAFTNFQRLFTIN